jgi:TonB family protein
LEPLALRIRLIAAALLSVPLLAAPDPALAQFLLNPDWAEKPEGASLSPHFPPVPMALGLQGRVVLGCQVQATGVVTGCSILNEVPKGLGFGDAALRMSRTFKMRPAVAPGALSPKNDVTIPLNFKLPEAPPALPSRTSSDGASVATARTIVVALGGSRAIADKLEADAKAFESGRSGGASTEAGKAAAHAIRATAPSSVAKFEAGVAGVLAERLAATELEAISLFAASELGARYFRSGDRATADLAREDARQRFMRAARESFCEDRECPELQSESVAVARAIVQSRMPRGMKWGRRPTPAEFLDAWPFRRLGLSGAAVLSCRIGPSGGPDDCTIIEESPAGLGVATAALKVAEIYRIEADQFGRGAVGRAVTLGVVFPSGLAPARAASAAAEDGPRLESARRLAALRHSAVPPSSGASERVLQDVSDFPAELRNAALRAIEAGDRAARAELREAEARYLARTYSADELERLIAFEDGPGTSLRMALRDPSVEAVNARAAYEHGLAAGAVFCAAWDCGKFATADPKDLAGATR